MARYDHLPIFKKAYDLCFEIEQQVKNFSRDYKYTIGAEIRQISHEIPALIMIANNHCEKKEYLEELWIKLEKLKLLVRLAFDLKCLRSISHYERLAEVMTDISRQNEGWLKSVK
ncbi:four helix bundle protein [Candidatus Falkowbacteria bacterium CG11_big_fil_rev_8_21_14_0_20_39_10]|uniref:Four helix bundle protein n=1 Tax=Candidatus Falkowbacteria bacterium CG11_big_fil_rev_8_21_14_0_20_39_10 TaxID=1974570 RepID=A0A2M6K806_9BACT|nr:MAG: four helix bundle protein [Candidatus Falkowbacteria bacterium CG11_big_fil_rev_8_21_14_0_20_39_10]